MKMNTTGMRRLIPYLKKYRFKITGAILLIIAASCLIALSPTLEGMITTQLFQDVTAGHGVNFTVIYRIVAVLLLVYVTGAICNCSYQRHGTFLSFYPFTYEPFTKGIRHPFCEPLLLPCYHF